LQVEVDVAAVAAVVEVSLRAACVSVADVLKLLETKQWVQTAMETAMALAVRMVWMLVVLQQHVLVLLAQKALLRGCRGTLERPCPPIVETPAHPSGPASDRGHRVAVPVVLPRGHTGQQMLCEISTVLHVHFQCEHHAHHDQEFANETWYQDAMDLAHADQVSAYSV
jgi:hypothetical protein